MCSTFNIPTSLHHITSYYRYYINISENDPSISPSPKLFPGKKKTAIRWFFALDLAESHKVHFQVSESPESLEQRSDQGRSLPSTMEAEERPGQDQLSTSLRPQKPSRGWDTSPTKHHDVLTLLVLDVSCDPCGTRAEAWLMDAGIWDLIRW